MTKKVRVVLALFVALQLTGCAKSILDQSDARCPFVERGGCQSMEQVNRMVDKQRVTPDGQFVQHDQCVDDCRGFAQ